MAAAPQIRLGSTIIARERKRFVLQDAHDASKTIEIVDVDVPDLILFLYKHCPGAQTRLSLTEAGS